MKDRWLRGFAAIGLGVLLTTTACGSDEEAAELVPVEDGRDPSDSTGDDAADTELETGGDATESADGDTADGSDAETDASADGAEAPAPGGDNTGDSDGGDATPDAEGDAQDSATRDPQQTTDADDGGAEGSGGGGQGSRPQNQQGGGGATEQDLEGPGPDNELTEATVGLDEALTVISVGQPCELYTAAELGQLVRTMSDDAGLTADLPPGLLGAGDPVAFEVDSNQATSCGWFSEPQIWALEISWQAADGSFAGNLLSRGEPLSGIGDQAALDGDTTGHVVLGDLLVSFSHLPPGHTSTAADRDVLIALMRETVDRLRG